jgi:SAM-dependent methyltransferase
MKIMKSQFLFLLLVVVCSCAQNPETPKNHQSEPGPQDYYGAYAPGAEPRFNQRPNAFLMECVHNRTPGKALDVGMGSGRNALYLAAHGWDVTGFDIAEVGVSQARRRAKKLGIKLNAMIHSDTDFDFGTEQWDLIVLTYQPFRDLLAKIKPSLKKGGVVVIENFHRETMRDRLLDEDATYRDNELLEIFSDFRILRYEDVAAKPDWGIEFPTNRLVRLEAQKGNPQQTGCDWKGTPKAVGATVKWGVMFLTCTDAGWIRVEVKGVKTPVSYPDARNQRNYRSN